MEYNPNHPKPEYRDPGFEFVEGVESFSSDDPDYALAERMLKDAQRIRDMSFKEVAESLEDYDRLVKERDNQRLQDRYAFLKATIVSYISWVMAPINLVFLRSDGKAMVRRAAKRGDRKYRQLIMKRLKPYFDYAKSETKVLFDRNNRSKVLKTNLLYITGTIPEELILADAWCKKMPYFYNLFIGRLRKRYGRCWALRTWESHENGMPHFHAIIGFEDHSFTIFSHKGKWRIHSRDSIRELWGTKWRGKNRGYVGLLKPTEDNPKGWFIMDIQAIDSFEGGLKYLSKYLTKATKFDAESGDTNEVRSLALMWRFRRRSFSVSANLYALLRGLDNSTDEVGSTGEFTYVLWGFMFGELSDEYFKGFLEGSGLKLIYLDPRFYVRGVVDG